MCDCQRRTTVHIKMTVRRGNTGECLDVDLQKASPKKCKNTVSREVERER